MSTVRFHLFSNHCVVRRSHDQKQIHLFPAARSLLAYLLVHRHRSHSRDVLAEVFWKHDGQQARQCLRTTLWRLRSKLEGEKNSESYLLISPEGDIAFNNDSDHWLDIAAFEEGVEQGLAAMGRGMAPAEATALEAACAYYEGDLLESVYDDWAIRERERLRLLYLRALTGLLRYYRREGVYEHGLACGQRILEMDPLREEVHREMMRLYTYLGQRALAVRQYEQCRAVLVDELDIGPMPETEAVYRQIMREEGGTLRAVPDQGQPASLQQAVQQVGVTVQVMEQAQAQLKQAMQLLLSLVEQGSEDKALRPKR